MTCPWCDTTVENDCMLLWVVRWRVRVGIGQGIRLCCNRELEPVSSLADFVFDICRSESREIVG